jgi:hypothetical protein
MNKLLQNVNVAGTSLFFQILAVGGPQGAGAGAASSLRSHHRRAPAPARLPPHAPSSPPPSPRQSDQRLAVPHISVADIRWVKWDALRAAGFRACVFDKDNTLCEPFALTVDPELAASVEAASAAFGGRLAIYSNSAGLEQYDPRGEAAAAGAGARGGRLCSGDGRGASCSGAPRLGPSTSARALRLTRGRRGGGGARGGVRHPLPAPPR